MLDKKTDIEYKGYIESMKDNAMKLAKIYGHNIKIEIDVNVKTAAIKIHIKEFDL